MTSPAAEFPRTTKALRAALDAAGVAPRKRHGQCFLTDVQAVDAIVRDAAVAADDAVIEIGTGTGLLTHALVEAGASVDTFDIDPEMQAVAKSLRAWPSRVRFHAGDALAGKRALSRAVTDALENARRSIDTAGRGRVLVVSNLPYNAATPVLLALLALADPPDEITAMVQVELAEKLFASPGSAEYGPPSVLRALEGDGRVLRRFPPAVFWPQPNVTSALLRLVPRRPRVLHVAVEAEFATFLIGLFTRRRKVLSTAVRASRPALSAEEAVAACLSVGADPRARPQDVLPATLLALERATVSRS